MDSSIDELTNITEFTTNFYENKVSVGKDKMIFNIKYIEFNDEDLYFNCYILYETENFLLVGSIIEKEDHFKEELQYDEVELMIINKEYVKIIHPITNKQIKEMKEQDCEDCIDVVNTHVSNVGMYG